jgi:hypothetical protein
MGEYGFIGLKKCLLTSKTLHFHAILVVWKIKMVIVTNLNNLIESKMIASFVTNFFYSFCYMRTSCKCL